MHPSRRDGSRPRPRTSCSFHAAIAGALAVLVAGRATAQDLDYQNFLIGTRAMGMGGAFTAVADDPSASYHNPAGLGLLLRSSTSANLTVIAADGWRMRGGYGSVLGPVDLAYNAIPALPIFVGLVQKFGDVGPDGVQQHGIAISVVRPRFIQRSFRVSIFDPEAGVADSIRIDEIDNDQWYGISYGLRVQPGLAIGIGGWLSFHDQLHTEELFVASGIAVGGSRYTADGLLAAQSSASTSSIGLVFRFGLLWQIDPSWRFGFMLQPGRIAITDDATIFSNLAATAGGGTAPIGDLRFADQTGLSGNMPTPWQLRIGTSYRFSESLQIAADFAVYAPIGSANNPVRTFGPPRADPVTGEVPSPGLFVAREWYANLTANASIGVDALIADLVPLQAGFFTDMSAAPEIVGPSPVYQPARVNGLGASIAAGVHRGDFDVQAGVAAIYGWGTGLGTNPDPTAPPSEAYLPRSVERYTVYFFLSGTERAAAGLVREILGELSGQRASGEEQQEQQEQAPAPEHEREGPPPVAIDYLRSPWPDLANEPASEARARVAARAREADATGKVERAPE